MAMAVIDRFRWTLAVACSVALCCAALPARAEPELGALELLSSKAQNSPVPSGFVPGAAVLGFQNRYAAQDDSLYVFPGFIYIDDKFIYLGDRARYYLHREGRLALFAFGRVRTGNLNPEKNAAFQGMHKRKWEAEAGIGGNLITDFGLFTFRASSDITGTSKGQEALAWVDFPVLFERALVMPGLGVIWRSSRLANYYFGGVGADEAAPGRPAYNTGSTFSPMAAVVTTYRLSKEWIATLSFGYEWYHSGTRNSPLVQHKGEGFAIAGIGYIW
jgi:MipA family protein